MSSVLIRLLGDNKHLLNTVDQARGVLGGMASAAATGVKAGGVAAGLAFGDGFFEAIDRQSLGDNLAGQLQISEADAKELVSVASQVYSEAWGESVESVSRVVADINDGPLDDQNEKLDNLVIGVHALSDAYGVDMARAVQIAEISVTEGLHRNGVAAIDDLTVLLGKVPTALREDVMDAAEEYLPFMAQLGLSGDKAFSLLSGAAQDGRFGLDKYGDALKELTIRGTDMSKASQEAFELMGKDAGLYAELLLEGGDAAADATFGIARGLLAIEDPVEQANAAIALFGTPLEDMKTSEIPGFLESLWEMDEAFVNNEDSAYNLGEQLGSNLATRFTTFKRVGQEKIVNFISEKILPGFEELVNWVEGHMPKIQEVSGRVFASVSEAAMWVVGQVQTYWPQVRDIIVNGVEFIQAKFTEYWPLIKSIVLDAVAEVVAIAQEHWPQVQEIVGEAVEAVRAVVDRVTKVITYIWERWGGDILAFLQGTWAVVSSFIGHTLDVIQGVFQGVTALMKGDWAGLWEAVKDIIYSAGEAIIIILERGWEAIQIAWDIALGLLKKVAEEVWDEIKGKVTGFVDDIEKTIKGAGTKLKDAANIAWDLLEGVIGERFASIVLQVVKWMGKIATKIIEYGTILGSATLSAFLYIKSNVITAVAGVATWVYDNLIKPVIDKMWELKDLLFEVLAMIPGVGQAVAGVNDAVSAIGGIGGGGGSTSLSRPRSAAQTQADNDAALLAAIYQNQTGGSGGSASINPATNTTINNYGNSQTVNSNIQTVNALNGLG